MNHSRDRKGHKINKSKSSGSARNIPYFKKVMEAFKSLYQIYQANKPTEISSLSRKIQDINEMHLSGPSSSNVPAICLYINNIPINQQNINFLNAMKEAGLNINISIETEMLLFYIAIKGKNILLLNWLMLRCNIKIPASNTNKNKKTPSFNDIIENMLENIEADILSPYAQNLIEKIPSHHCDGNSILHLAALHNKPNLFISLIENGADINQTNHHGLTAVMLAVEYNSDDVIKVILENSLHDTIDVTLKTANHETIFHKAILGAEPHIFDFALNKLQEQEISFTELTTKYGFNIIHWAIDKKQDDIITKLLPLVDLNAPGPDGYHLITYAFINDAPDIGYSIAEKCDLDVETSKFNNNKNIVELVIESDAVKSFVSLMEEGFFDIKNLSTEGLPPLLLAAKSESYEILDTILCTYSIEELQICAETCDGKRCGHYIVSHNFVYQVEYLLKQQALDFNHKDHDGNTVLDIALLYGESHLKITNLLLDYIEKDAVSKKRKLSFRLSEIKELQTLLNIYFTDIFGVRASRIDGYTPLQIACLTYDIDYINDVVKSHRLNINQKNDKGETVLSLLIQNAALEKIISIVTNMQAKITDLDKNDSTLLQLACEHELEPLVRWCLDTTSLSITKPRKDKFSALDLTLIRRNSTILNLLWEKLSSKQSEVYIEVLLRKKESILLEYLQKTGLYSPIANPASNIQESAHPLETLAIANEDCHQPHAQDTQHDHHSQIQPKRNIICDEETLFDCIEKQNFSYFKALKHYPEHNQLLALHAKSLLLAAIHTTNHRLVYHLLRIPVIAEQAHLDDNAALVKACEMGLNSIVEALLRINSIVLNLKSNSIAIIEHARANGHEDIVEVLKTYCSAQDNDDKSISPTTTIESEKSNSTDSIPDSMSPIISSFDDDIQPENLLDGSASHKSLHGDLDIFKIHGQQLDVHAKPFEKLPNYLTSSPLIYQNLMDLSGIFNQCSLDGYIFGSTHYSLHPGDLDIFIPDYSFDFDTRKINQLISSLISAGGTVTSIDPRTNTYGYSYEGRYIIPFNWRGIKIELVCTPQTILEHASNLDFTVGAKYLSIATLTYTQIPSIQANQDIELKRIQTVCEADNSFLIDPRRIFRAIKLMVNENFSLSDECYHAIQRIFQEENNPFITHTTPKKIYHCLEKIAKSGRAHEYFEIFNNLGIFNKLYACFTMRSDYTAKYYKDLLTPYYTMYNEKALIQSETFDMQNPNLIFNRNRHTEQPQTVRQPSFAFG